MITRPNTYPNWTDGDPSKVQQPSAPFLLQGWVPGQAPPAQYFNWVLYIIDQWIKYLDALTNTGVPDQAIRLINGGNWSFDSVTQLLSWSATANIAIPGMPDSANALAAGNATLNDGDIGYVDIDLPILATASGANGSNMLTNMNYTGNLSIGMSVLGPGVPGSTTVVAVNASSVQLSNNLIADETDQTYFFSTVNVLTMQTATSATFIPSFGTLLVARRVGKDIYLGVNCTQMGLQDGELKELEKTGYLQSYDEVLAGVALTKGQAVYICDGELGRTTGRAYPLDTSSGNAIRSAFAGFVTTNANVGTAVNLVFSGFFKFTGLQPGKIYYGDPAIPGAIITPKPVSAGVSVVPVGIALTSTKLLLTSSESASGPNTQAIFMEDDLGPGNGSIVNFTLSETPIDQNSTFVFLNGIVQDKSLWSLVGNVITFNTAPTSSQEVEAQYIQVNQAFVAAAQEVPVYVDATHYQLAGLPINQASFFAFVDGVKLTADKFSLLFAAGSCQIVLNTALGPGQDLYVAYFQNSASSTSGVVTNAQNEGTGGVGLFDTLASGILKFLSIKAGANISLTPDGLGNVVIAASGGGSFSRQVYGSPGSPQSFSPVSGLNPGSEMEQTWILESSGGAQIVTANPQIAAGTIVGQRLTLRGTNTTDYYTFEGTDGSIVRGLSLNGDCNITSREALVLEWDGIVWYEITRRL